MEKGYNLRTIKDLNRSSVLFLINKMGTCSRTFLAKKLGLTKAALTKIIHKLLQEKIVAEFESKDKKRGRKEVLLSLNIEGLYSFGITFEKGLMTLSITSLKGDLKELKTFEKIESFNKIKQEIFSFYNEFQYKYKLEMVGVSYVGQPYGYVMWPAVDIEKELKEKIKLPFVLENNIKSFSLASILNNEINDQKNVLVFKWGPGIGSCLINDEKIISFNKDNEIEIGHIIVDGKGQSCRCGNAGCLENYAMLPYNFEKIDFKKKNKEELTKVKEKINMVSLNLFNLSILLNVKTIILFGKAFLNDSFYKLFIDKWKTISPRVKSINIKISKLNKVSSYIGSNALVLYKLFF